MKGKVVEYAGNYGQTQYVLVPIPKNPPTITDKWGWKWLYLGVLEGFEDEFIRVAKANKEGLVDIRSLGPMRKDYFPELI